ncbi:protein HOMOLOG OF MAMMALIAN LYST-INTERACTING PROTEIN 5-like isoform X2 [Phragmites australis]|uniref:protein HOMOLOG OF MAMMALIAN LYST-INTERACTING PROTEIN 5-like isoform X2 n=1 Tax=Phragmites australis TaxID=29695 RepID=UPI002D76B589|nr:protein HOMOLOG OF MAMMALIAN LYST-INTERACTING PROTEIN 5-like isoform X2 [Phragmites australis]
MGSEAEPAKGLLPYLQRADELQKHEPLVAYYCRLYAMEKGLRIPQKERTKITNSILVSLMNQLEKDKKSLTLGPDDHFHVEGFALNVFAKADKQDRAGRADINTAKTFYAASIFFEILNQFGELQPDIEQKQKYAIWKAAEIRKALKEGRKPEAGPPGGDKDEAPDMGRSESFSSRQHGSEAPSQPVDKDFSRRDSLPTIQPGNNEPRQSREFHDHSFAQSPYSPPPPQSQHPSPSQSYSSPSHQGTDYPSDVHIPPPNYSSSPYTSTDYPTKEVHKQPSNYSPPPYTRTDYPSSDGYNPHSNDKPDVSAYPQTYQPPPYTIEPQHTSQNYYSTETPPAPYNYPNFQSYPSFQDSTSPSVPTHQSSFYPAGDGPAATSYSPASNPSAPTHHSSADSAYQATTTAAPPASQYRYDSNYQPEVVKIAEAHKAARFAVGALAFDDVSVAVDHLKRALDLLTNPSAETH